jgi:hypothetical protein
MAMHEGGFKCRRVRFAVEVGLEDLVSCNCSRCGKLGSALSFAHADAFELRSGEDALTVYRFNTHTISHFSCATCGIEPFGGGAAPDERAMVAINVRCLDDVDVFALKPQQVEGKSF